MKEIHYLRETIYGKRYELMYLELKLKKMAAKNFSKSSPLAVELRDFLKQ